MSGEYIGGPWTDQCLSINCVSARIHIPTTMKIVIVFAALAAVCLAENCSQDSDCVLTVCGTGQRIDCYRRDDSHVCTCMPTDGSSGSGVTCNTPDQCKSNYGDCTHGDHKWHCIDNKCRCSFWG